MNILSAFENFTYDVWLPPPQGLQFSLDARKFNIPQGVLGHLTVYSCRQCWGSSDRLVRWLCREPPSSVMTGIEMQDVSSKHQGLIV